MHRREIDGAAIQIDERLAIVVNERVVMPSEQRLAHDDNVRNVVKSMPDNRESVDAEMEPESARRTVIDDADREEQQSAWQQRNARRIVRLRKVERSASACPERNREILQQIELRAVAIAKIDFVVQRARRQTQRMIEPIRFVQRTARRQRHQRRRTSRTSTTRTRTTLLLQSFRTTKVIRVAGLQR